MAKARQITVWVKNSPGQLARIGKALGAAKVNCTGLSAYAAGVESPIRLLAANPARARKALAGLGLRVTEEDVLRLTLPEKAGQLALIAERLAQANINIDYAYETVAPGSKKAALVLAVSDLAGSLRALHGL